MEKISWFALLCSFAGNVLINLQIFLGFFLFVASNALWAWFDLRAEEWKITKQNRARMLMYAGFTALNVHGIVSWVF